MKFKILFVILLLCAAILFFYYSISPLKIVGYTVIHDKAIIIEIKNEGKSDIQIENVLVDSHLNHVLIEFGVSYSLQVVNGTGLNKDNNILFEEIGKQKIHPDLTYKKKMEEIRMRNGTPIHYGIRINDENIKEVIVSYRYWGMRFSKKVNFKSGDIGSASDVQKSEPFWGHLV
ncbi:hypothetical protein [Paenibacillus sp. PAMC21692]|uniref:hypothetical protein n=1 Tax=Paenibacillus sp. PAMC21692 TaxID=2762320 RepID=UPI00164E07A1|nr:hypothetical protein [Paenibacillus sp. PAMC21692]QNK58008.1 hypothetical protein H7F31_03340 [Paenibacillus sp. PAMC21692]